MVNDAVGALLTSLRSDESRAAWAEFLRQFSPVIFQTCQFATADADEAADCFLFACEQLCQNNFRRLLRFRPEGSASFTTWLKVVVRNLCLDWRRKQFGRPRPFASISRMPQLEGEVFRCRFEQRLSSEETLLVLHPSFPALTMDQLAETEDRVRSSLTPRQLWLLNSRCARDGNQLSQAGVTLAEDEDAPEHEVRDPRPTQEDILYNRQRQQLVNAALSKLPAMDRVVVRLRFQEGLSLEQIARLTGLGDAQRVHRHIANILERLRKEISATQEKSRAASV